MNEYLLEIENDCKIINNYIINTNYNMHILSTNNYKKANSHVKKAINTHRSYLKLVHAILKNYIYCNNIINQCINYIEIIHNNNNLQNSKLEESYNNQQNSYLLNINKSIIEKILDNNDYYINRANATINVGYKHLYNNDNYINLMEYYISTEYLNPFINITSIIKFIKDYKNNITNKINVIKSLLVKYNNDINIFIQKINIPSNINTLCS